MSTQIVCEQVERLLLSAVVQEYKLDSLFIRYSWDQVSSDYHGTFSAAGSRYDEDSCIRVQMVGRYKTHIGDTVGTVYVRGSNNGINVKGSSETLFKKFTECLLSGGEPRVYYAKKGVFSLNGKTEVDFSQKCELAEFTEIMPFDFYVKGEWRNYERQDTWYKRGIPSPAKLDCGNLSLGATPEFMDELLSDMRVIGSNPAVFEGLNAKGSQFFWLLGCRKADKDLWEPIIKKYREVTGLGFTPKRSLPSNIESRLAVADGKVHYLS
ncbi:MAG: hypothetical protein GY861_20770 [bacterium]|nr:hypothetical protein [bacterium]